MINYLRKRKKIIFIGSLVMLATTIPYLLGYASQGSEWRFTGFLIGIKDGNSYIAKMLSGANGAWLFRSPYSAEPQRGMLAFFPYLLLGKLTGGSAQHEQLVALFHAYRFLAGIMLALAINDFLALFISRPARRIWAVLIVLLGGGLGWVLAVAELKNFLGSIPLDFLSPESFGFLGLFGLPHLTLARALLFWGAANYLRRESSVIAGVNWLLMGFFQPLYILVIWVVIGLHALADTAWNLLQKRPGDRSWHFQSSYLKKAFVAGLISSPFVIYTAALLSGDDYLAAWTAQNVLPSPHWIHYLIAYGLILPLALWGIKRIMELDRARGLFLACWVIAFPFLISTPFPTQRRLAEGIWVIFITGFFGFFTGNKALPLYGKVLLALLFPTSILLLWGSSVQASNPASPLFLTTQEVEAYLALKENAPADSLVLSSFEVGNSLPAWAPVRVVQGHGPETVHLAIWQQRIDDTFSPSDGLNDCSGLLEEGEVDYLFWGPKEERAWNWDPDLRNCLRQVYNSNGYKIYKVQKQSN